jgi:hypothetical protein
VINERTVALLPLTASKVLNHISGNHTHWRNQMSDESKKDNPTPEIQPEIKKPTDTHLPDEELKKVVGGGSGKHIKNVTIDL